MVPALSSVFAENGHGDVTVEATEFVGLAATLATPGRLEFISEELNKRPDVTIVHLSAGINDLHCLLVNSACTTNWNPNLIGTPAEADILATIMDDAETIVDHIFSIRPEMKILWAGGDYTRPRTPQQKFGSPAEHNGVHIRFAELAQQLAIKKPGLRFVDLFGLLQVTYGFDGIQYTPWDPSVPIPPGDPSLPDATLPSPKASYANEAHPTVEGYRVWAEGYFEAYYADALSGATFEFNAGLNGNWWNGPDRNGEGVQLEVSAGIDGGLVLVATVYSYDTQGRQIFLVAVGAVGGDTAEVEVFITSGGVWGEAFEPEQVTESPWGSGTFTAVDCDEIHMALIPNTEYQGEGFTSLVYGLGRLTTPSMPCPVDGSN
jgi:lysophospholipase L1-like esterase